MVPVIFDGIAYTFAVVMGAGDRANLGDETADTINKFYAVIDDLDNDSTTYPAYDLTRSGRARLQRSDQHLHSRARRQHLHRLGLLAAEQGLGPDPARG